MSTSPTPPTASDEHAGGRICATLAVVNSKELPTVVQERWRVEFILPAASGCHDVPVVVVDEMSHETYLSTVAGYDGSRHPAELASSGLCLAVFGTPEPPQNEPRGYPWNRVFFLVVAQPQEPFATQLAHLVVRVHADKLCINHLFQPGPSGSHCRKLAQRDRDPVELVLREISEAIRDGFKLEK